MLFVFVALGACAVGVSPANIVDASDDEADGDAEAGVGTVADAGASKKSDAGTRDASKQDAEALTSGDDAAAPACAGYALPNETGPCKACQASSPTCQPNGCFGGYYCMISAPKCQPKPSGC